MLSQHIGVIYLKICIIRNAEAKTNASMMRVVDALTSEGHEIILLSRSRENISSTKKYISKDFTFKGNRIKNIEIQLPFEYGKSKSVTNPLKYMYLVMKWLYANRQIYDTVHAFDLDTGLPSWLARKLLHKKMIYHIADFYADSRIGIPNRIRNVFKRLEFKVIKDAELTIVCTEDRKRQIAGSKPKNLIVVHNTPLYLPKDTNQSKKFNTDNKDPLKLSYVGGLTQVRFIEEILEVVSKDQSLYLDIAGYGPLSHTVKDYDDKYANINYHGQLDYEQSLEVNAKSDVMFAIYDPKLPNHKYSAPNKVYEAMAFGKPIIVAKSTGVDELVLKEKMGVVTEYNVESFTEVIKEFKDNPELVKQLSENSINAYSTYSWEKMKALLNNAYRKI